MMTSFIKMHGLGNDFVILDNRKQDRVLSADSIRLLSDRRFGIGCDQFIVLEKACHPQAYVFMRIYNADGHEAGACGNATRCVSFLLWQEDGQLAHTIETVAGLLPTEVDPLDPTSVTVDLGEPIFEWQEIPLARAEDPLHLPLVFESLKDPVALSVGNPHLVFFVYDVDSIDLDHVGKSLTHHPLFPEGANVDIVEKINDETLRMRVYERGVGITLACGTGACAAVVAAQKRGLIHTSARVILEGGELLVHYDGQGTVKMKGHIAFVFKGLLNDALFSSNVEKKRFSTG